jgi:hypothetical protein
MDKLLSEIALDLCHAIESQPGCEQLTKCSVLASQLRQELERYEQTRPLTADETAMIDRAWKAHEAAGDALAQIKPVRV